MDEKVLGFEEKLQQLLAEAKRKKNVLEEQEVQDFFSGDNLDGEKWDTVFDFLDANKVDILRIGNDDIELEPEELFEEEEIDLEQIDLTVPDGIGVEDPVRMYLKDIGKIPLLSPEGEIQLARRIEA